MNNNIKQATAVTFCTMMNIISDTFPLHRGNCFSVSVEGETTHYRIVNFYLENLKEAIKRGITWPVQIKVLKGNYAVIHDSRIPDDWYRKSFCEICCPTDLLPITQLLMHERQNESGVRVEYPSKEEVSIIKLDFTKQPKLEEAEIKEIKDKIKVSKGYGIYRENKTGEKIYSSCLLPLWKVIKMLIINRKKFSKFVVMK